MTGLQKAIKYLAMALAIFLIVSIFSGIFGAVGLLGLIETSDAVAEDLTAYPVSGSITSLKIEINAADLTVEQADAFSVESNLKELTVSEKDGILTIREKARFAKNYNGAVLILRIPRDHVFTAVELTTGAGRVSIDTLSADRLDLELGAGEVQIGELNASAKAEVEGGAGKITVSDGTLHDLKLDMGVGQLNLTGAVLGDSELNLGVGETNLVLLGTKEDYRIKLEEGIGSAAVEGESLRNGGVYGTGANDIDIEGGIGAIKISFQSAA